MRQKRGFPLWPPTRGRDVGGLQRREDALFCSFFKGRTDVCEAYGRGRTPVVIVQRKDHASNLLREIKKRGLPAFLLIGEGTAKQKRESMAEVNAVPEGERFVLVVTRGYVGEGFDVSRLDTLLLASLISWEAPLVQCVGRVGLHFGFVFLLEYGGSCGG